MPNEQDRIDALSGGAPLPQAATMAIAKRLLGPQLAERYGDVLGARPTGIADAARDFSIGMMSGDPTKADQLKAQIVEGYNTEKRRDAEDDARKREEARTQLTGFFNLMQQGKKVPKGLRKAFFEEGFKNLELDVSSPLLMQVVTNYEKFGSIYDALSDPIVQQLSDDDPLPAQQKLVEMGYDGGQVIEFTNQVQQTKRYRAQTGAIIAKAHRDAAVGLAHETPRAKWIAKWAGQTVTDQTSGAVRVISPEELNTLADSYFPASGIAQTGSLPAIVPTGRPSGTKKTGGSTRLLDQILGGKEVPIESAGTPEAAPLGIPQAAKPRAITGNVTRLAE